MRLTIDGEPAGFKRFTFPGGEVQVRLAEARPAVCRAARIQVLLRDSESIMALLMLTDAVRRRWLDLPIHLVCPYLPYARQDRVAYEGEALGAAVLCRLLNAQGYASVEVWDAHSDVSLALLDRVKHRPAADFVAREIGPNDVLVSPDRGAARRVAECARRTGAPVIHADKTRDTDTGAIGGTTVHSGPVGGRDFLVIDDICDGGRTFLDLADRLRPLTTGRVRLYVTHGIFSAGFDALRARFDEILVANPFASDPPDFVRIVGERA